MEESQHNEDDIDHQKEVDDEEMMGENDDDDEGEEEDEDEEEEEDEWQEDQDSDSDESAWNVSMDIEPIPMRLPTVTFRRTMRRIQARKATTTHRQPPWNVRLVPTTFCPYSRVASFGTSRIKCRKCSHACSWKTIVIAAMAMLKMTMAMMKLESITTRCRIQRMKNERLWEA